MPDLQAVGLTMALIVALGKFLDSEYLSLEAKDKARLGLIRFFIFLEDYPTWLLDTIGNASEKALFRNESKVEANFYKLYFPVGFPIMLVALTILHDPSILSDFIGWMQDPYTRIDFLSVIWMAMFSLIVIPLVIIVGFLLFFSPIIIALSLITEVIRRTFLIILDKATSPKTSPFSYFSALLAVVVASLGIVHYYTKS